MRYLIIIIGFVLGLLLVIKLFDIGKNKFELAQVRKLTGLNIKQNEVSQLKYITVSRSILEKYPYVLFVKFEISKAN